MVHAGAERVCVVKSSPDPEPARPIRAKPPDRRLIPRRRWRPLVWVCGASVGIALLLRWMRGEPLPFEMWGAMLLLALALWGARRR